MIQLIALLLLTLSAHAEIHETPDLKSCFQIADRSAAARPPLQTIYVFDIDNTVLSLNQNFGSVQWFRWQSSLIQNGIVKDRVADSIEQLLDYQAHIYQLSKTHTPEIDTAFEIHKLQGSGHRVLYHTSRNTDVRDITERELKNHKLIPLTNTIGPNNGYAGELIFASGPEKQRPVTFRSGIFMSAGQDKGIWLQLLLNKTDTRPRHIVFVDDERKNLVNVENALAEYYALTLCRYSKVDERVRQFNESDKATEIQLWHELFNTIQKLN